MIQLRPYQEDIISGARRALTRHKNILIRSETGSGKTALAVFMMGEAAKRGKRSIFIVHQAELLGQTSGALWRQRLEHGVIAPGKMVSRLLVQVAMVQTLVRRLDKTDEPDLIFIDECHRSASPTYQKVIDNWPNARVIGLTATPRRTDSKGLDHIYSEIVEGPSMRQLIDAGFLADYEIIAPPISAMDISSVKTKMGDYDKKQLEEEMDKPTITGDAVNTYRKHASGKRCVVMCVSVKHAEHVRDQYRANGIHAEVIEGSLQKGEREKIIEGFRDGDFKVICSVELLIVGVDIPSIECVQWLRPTQSLIIWLQGIGRGLRPSPGKEKLLIIDHVGNWQRHDLPDDERTWTLEGGKSKGRKKPEDEVTSLNTTQCPAPCFAIFRKTEGKCPKCGNPLELSGRKELEVVDGELEVLDKEVLRKQRKQEQGQARSLRDLIQLGIRRGMNKPSAWACITMAARSGKKPSAEMFAEAKKIMAEIQSGDSQHGEAF